MTDCKATRTRTVLDAAPWRVSDVSDKVLDRTHVRPSGVRAVAPGKPMGKLEMPRVRALRTVTPRALPQTAPLRWETAYLALAGAVVNAVAPGGDLSRTSLPDRLEDAITAHTRPLFREGLEKRGIALAHAAAMTYLGHCVPAGAYFAGRAAAIAAADLPDGALRRRVTAAPTGLRRLGWSSDGTATGVLLLDRLHCVWLGDLVLTDWMRAQVAADLALGEHLAPGTFAGVRVIAHQVMARSVHVLPDWSSHALGECERCLPGGCWA